MVADNIQVCYCTVCKLLVMDCFCILKDMDLHWVVVVVHNNIEDFSYIVCMMAHFSCLCKKRNIMTYNSEEMYKIILGCIYTFLWASSTTGGVAFILSATGRTFIIACSSLTLKRTWSTTPTVTLSNV